LLQPIDQITQLIAPSKVRKEDNETRTKLATTFNTNRTYINEAARLKQGREKKKEEGKLYGRGNTKDEKVLSIIDRTFNEKETHNTQKIIAEIRERSESGTFTRSNNLLLQPIDPNTNAAATNY
jgi:hypothetical protein